MPCLPSAPVERQQQPVPEVTLPNTADPSPAPTDAATVQQIADLPAWALVTIVVLGAMVLVLGYLLARAALSGGSRQPSVAAQPEPTQQLSPTQQPAPGSGALLQALIGAYDLSSSDVVRAHVQKSLRTAGVTAIEPLPGDPFEAAFHNGVATVPSPSPELALTVARLLRPGWISSDSVLRPADVEIYKE